MRWKVLGFEQLRLICSLLVLVGHARILSIGEFDSKTGISPWRIVFYWFTSLGHSAVLVFFVLSGYLIGTPLVKKMSQSEIDLAEFIVRRLSRIWIVLIPSFFAIALLNRFACSLGKSSLYCKGNLRFNMSKLPPLQMQSGRSLLRNTTFQFGDSNYHAFGGNLPLWSLNYEIFAYVLIAVLVYSFQLFRAQRLSPNFRKLSHSQNFWVFLGCLGWIFYAKPSLESLSYFFIFVLGILAGLLKRRQKRQISWRLFIGLSLLQIIFLGQGIRFFPIFQITERLSLIDFLFAVIFALLLMKSPEERLGQAYYKNRSLLDFSFSLYVTHLPILGLISTLIENEHKYLKLNSFQEFTLMVISSIIFSFIFSLLTEAHTKKIRILILRKLNKA